MDGAPIAVDRFRVGEEILFAEGNSKATTSVEDDRHGAGFRGGVGQGGEERNGEGGKRWRGLEAGGVKECGSVGCIRGR